MVLLVVVMLGMFVTDVLMQATWSNNLPTATLLISEEMQLLTNQPEKMG